MRGTRMSAREREGEGTAPLHGPGAGPERTRGEGRREGAETACSGPERGRGGRGAGGLGRPGQQAKREEEGERFRIGFLF